MPGASPRLSATVRQRWLSLLPSRHITAQLQPTAQTLPWLTALADGAMIIQARKGVYGVKQVIVVVSHCRTSADGRENGADLTLDNT